MFGKKEYSNPHCQALSTGIRFHLKTTANGDQKHNFLETLSGVEMFENAVFVFSCGW